ncbi:MAG TPA: translational GTPase TypA [Acidimicrobiales bacterium]
MAVRSDIRNIAIVAHVDHGKTTLLDALLRQTGQLRSTPVDAERVMDSGDLEQEKGITILAKNTAITHRGVRINVVDTPGHADFGGEVERALAMVDAVLLLVDAAEGPLPQTRFVLRKALAKDLPTIVVLNKVDRRDARTAEVLDEVYQLYLDLDADDHQIEFPVVSCVAREGRAAIGVATVEGLDDDLGVLLDLLLSAVPAPEHDLDHPLQAAVTNLDASAYVGRLALCRIHHGTLRKGATVAWCRGDGDRTTVRITELYRAEGLERLPAIEAGPGDIAAVAGIPDIMIGDTLTDVDDPRPLEPLTVDEPALSMLVGVNTAPLSGQDGSKVTARQVRNRLDTELIGNVSIRVNDVGRPDAWEVQGRGELQLAVLVETMRREGFELTVGKPAVVIRDIDGVPHEPVERVTIDAPALHVGAVTELLAGRRGRMEHIHHTGSDWVRIEHLVPARGLVGMRTELLTRTRGEAVIHHTFERWEPWLGELDARPFGSLVADRTGSTTTYALHPLTDRGTLYIQPGDQVYEGMVIGRRNRPDDLDVNVAKERKVTNVRQSTAEELVRLPPPESLTLEQALERIAPDECVEVTPTAVRMRKVTLDKTQRARSAKRVRNAV